MLAALCVSCLWAPRVAVAQSSPAKQAAPAVAASPDPKVLADFQMRLDGYLKLRESLARRLKPLSPTPNAAELAARQESLAAAIKSERKNAKVGDLIPPAMALHIRNVVATDFKRRAASDTKAAFEEVAVGARPAINTTYPAKAALPTVPPLLLNKLPKLPDNLQYRFYARHILLLDGDTELVTDYILNVLPPLAKGDPDHD
jgi:hypothetical protein